MHTALQKAKLRHKASGSPEALKDLTELQELFLCLLDLQTHKQFRFMAHKYYEHGNKFRQMLARALRKRHAQTYIQKLHTTSGELTIQSSKIASGFRDYYATVYNLDSELPPALKDTRQRVIQ